MHEMQPHLSATIIPTIKTLIFCPRNIDKYVKFDYIYIYIYAMLR